MIVLIDNYDSFSYNCVQAMASQGADVKVFRNDKITVQEIAALNPAGIVISPGPCSPAQAGISIETAKKLAGKIPILGVCLGHQALGAAFGAEISNAGKIMHGKTSSVKYKKTPIYEGMKNPFLAGRYHSLAVLEKTLPPQLIANAWSEDGELMGMHHRDFPVFGVQFHPESILTPGGKRIFRNFMLLTSEIGKTS